MKELLKASINSQFIWQLSVSSSKQLCAELKNASANTVILVDSAFFHSHTGSDKLHHAPQTGWYVYKWQTPVSKVVDMCLHIELERVLKEEIQIPKYMHNSETFLYDV